MISPNCAIKPSEPRVLREESVKSNPSTIAPPGDKSFRVWRSMDYRGIIFREARKNGIRVYYHGRGAQWGRSDLGGKRIFIPTPHRFPSFFTGLHEIGHIASNHHSWDGKPEYLWEYEAFDWALKLLQRQRNQRSAENSQLRTQHHSGKGARSNRTRFEEDRQERRQVRQGRRGRRSGRCLREEKCS